MVWDESNLVLERVNGATVTEANLFRLAVHSLLSNKAKNAFSKMIKSLNVETVPFDEEKAPDRLLPEGYEEE